MHHDDDDGCPGWRDGQQAGPEQPGAAVPGDGALAAAGGEHAGPLGLVLRRRHRQARADDVNIWWKCVFNKYLWFHFHWFSIQ